MNFQNIMKEARHRGSYIVWFHLYEISRREICFEHWWLPGDRQEKNAEKLPNG